MLCLGLDTSTEISSVALADDSRLLAEYSFAHKMDLSRRLMANVTALLRDCRASLQDLRGIGVCIGPGSFTGLRIGVVMANTLAQLLDVPVTGIVSLDLLAHQFDCLPDQLVCPLIKARKGEVYYALYKTGQGSLERLSDYAAGTVDEVIEKANEYCRTSPLLVCGDGVPDTLDHLGKVLGDRVIEAPPWLAYPKAGLIASLAAERIALGQVSEAQTVYPFYIRPSAPEMRMTSKSEPASGQ